MTVTDILNTITSPIHSSFPLETESRLPVSKLLHDLIGNTDPRQTFHRSISAAPESPHTKRALGVFTASIRPQTPSQPDILHPVKLQNEKMEEDPDWVQVDCSPSSSKMMESQPIDRDLTEEDGCHWVIIDSKM